MKRHIKIILSWLLIIAIPIATLGLSANIILRLHDLYQYQINKGDILKEYKAASQSEEVSELIAKYMQHRADELQYQTDAEDEMSLVFTRTDQEKGSMIRSIADVLAVMTLICMVIICITYFVLIREEHLAAIRARFKIAALIYILMALPLLLCGIVSSFKDKIIAKVFYGLEEIDFTYKLINCGTFTMFCIAIVVLATIMMIILTYFTWSKTKERGIFW